MRWTFAGRIWLKEWKTKSWTSTKQERGLQRQRRAAGVEPGAQKQEIQNKKVERRLLGKNLRFVQRVQLAATAKQAGGVKGRRRDEAAAKNEDYETSDKENLIKKQEWTLKTDGGFLSFWRQTVRKRGSIQDGKTPCRSGMSGQRK